MNFQDSHISKYSRTVGGGQGINMSEFIDSNNQADKITSDNQTAIYGGGSKKDKHENLLKYAVPVGLVHEVHASYDSRRAWKKDGKEPAFLSEEKFGVLFDTILARKGK
jgi:hypothetical protein